MEITTNEETNEQAKPNQGLSGVLYIPTKNEKQVADKISFSWGFDCCYDHESITIRNQIFRTAHWFIYDKENEELKMHLFVGDISNYS